METEIGQGRDTVTKAQLHHVKVKYTDAEKEMVINCEKTYGQDSGVDMDPGNNTRTVYFQTKEQAEGFQTSLHTLTNAMAAMHGGRTES